MDLQIDREVQSPKGGGIQGEMREKKGRGGEGGAVVVREFPSRATLSQEVSFPLLGECKMCSGEIQTISTGQGYPRPYTPEAHSPHSVARVTGERVQAKVQVFIREGNRGGWSIPSAPG